MENNGNIAEIKRICDLYNENKFFEIPPYQRLYEWSNDEINELLNDMKEAWRPSILSNSNVGENEQKSSKSYFIGTVTISVKTNEQDKENNDKNKVYKLIDGQQRLTTLWFIGFYLASNEKCGEWQKKWQKFIIQGENLRIVMPIRDSEENALKELTKKIIDGKYKFKQDNKIAPFEESQNIHQKIIEAFSCIESWFVNGNGKNIDLANFAKYIYKNICFVFVTLAQNTDLNRFFVRMNNRGKQLEKHEILKARMLGVIQKSGGEWQKYAKIWDLCSDMDKYIFQSASDRKILNFESKNEIGQSIDEIIKAEPDNNNTKRAENDDTSDKVESIVDFPTFLLHCYKLWVAKKCENKDSEIPKEITITKDKLLDIMWVKQNNFKTSGKYCEGFIKYMLYYRVLFDYFVIKNNANTKQGNAFRIRRLESYKSGKNTYYRLPDDSKSVSDNSPFKALTTLQNYLRVARQGEKQNYHHWLTPFLAYLDNEEISKKIWRIVECDFVELDKIAELFERNANNDESNIISFLENLDTKLAIAQLNKTSENDLLGITNETLLSINKHLYFPKEQASRWQKYKNIYFSKKCFLNQGTKTPHYWFYRLEYYLWKWGSQKDKINNDKIKNIFAKFDSLEFPNGEKFNFEKILSAFYFRNLNSVEHIEPQSNAEDGVNGWKIYKDDKGNIIKRDIDCFGNLALISPAFNSQLSNQSNRHKALDLRKKIDDGNAESLKLWLVYAQHIEEGNKWTYENAKNHQEQMLEILKQSLEI